MLASRAGHFSFSLILFPQEFESRIAALENEKEVHFEEVQQLQQEVKDKEVESRIAGKKGDQLVSIIQWDRIFRPR